MNELDSGSNPDGATVQSNKGNIDMSVLQGFMKNENSGLRVPVYSGFSWPCLFFGPFWYLSKGMVGKALSYLFVYPGFVYPFVANHHYRDYLAKLGYKLMN